MKRSNFSRVSQSGLFSQFDFLFSITFLLVAAIATPIFGFRDIATAELSGDSSAFEQIILGAIMTMLTLGAGSLIFHRIHLSGLGLLALSSAYLLRQSIGAFGTGAVGEMETVTLGTLSYLGVHFMGLAFLVLGWKQGEHWLVGHDNRSAIPSWLRQDSSGVRISMGSRLLQIIAMANAVVIAYLIGRVIWPNSILFLMTIVALLIILGVMVVVTLINTIQLNS